MNAKVVKPQPMRVVSFVAPNPLRDWVPTMRTRIFQPLITLASPRLPARAAPDASACSSARTTTPSIAISWRTDAACMVWPSIAYRVMPNHVHLILVPVREEAPGRARRGAPGEIGKRRLEVVTPAKAGVQRRRHRLLENQLFSVS